MLVNCKACGKEIGKGVRKCVNCGADQRNFFVRHKILTGILAIFIIAGISLMFSPSTTPIQTKDGRTISAKTLTFPDGRKYVGEFNKGGDASGYGILYKADGGISYEGEFINGQPAILSAAPAPAPAPAPVAVEKKWTVTNSWSGNGAKDTENFAVTENTRINWETTDAKGIFQIYIQDTKGTPVGIAANMQGVGKDVSYLHLTPGQYSFKINSAFTPWKITVEQQQ